MDDVDRLARPDDAPRTLVENEAVAVHGEEARRLAPVAEEDVARRRDAEAVRETRTAVNGGTAASTTRS